MMTLTQAIESGKEFTRQSLINGGDSSFFDAETFVASLNVADITATDYVLKPEGLTVGLLGEIWNRSRSSGMPTYGDSKVFAKIVAELRGVGLIKEA